MINRFKETLAVTTTANEDDARIIRILSVILISTLVANILYTISLFFLFASRSDLIINIVIFLLEVMALTVMIRGNVRLASLILTISLWLYFTFVLFVFGGSQSPAIVGYFIVIVMAGLLLGGKSAIFFSLLSAAAGLGLLYGEIEGLVPEPVIETTPTAAWLSFLVALFIMSVLLYLTTSSLQEALDKARNNASALKENNEQLEETRFMLQNRVEELKLAEEALRQSEERLRTVVSSAPILLWGIDTEGIITVAQGETLAEFGFSTTRVLGTSIFQYEKTIPNIKNHVLRSMNGENIVSVEQIRGRTLEMRYSPMYNNDLGKVRGVIGIAVDITDRVSAEEALRQAQKLESLGVLAGGIAHDFNNLLVAMMAQNSVAMAKLEKDHSAYGNIVKAFRAAERAADLTRQMLAYAGRGRFDMGKIQLNELVLENLDLLRVSIGKNVRLNSDLSESLSLVYGDLSQLQQVIMNLIINGADAIGDELGEVWVKTRPVQISGQFDLDYWRNVTPDLAAGEYVAVEVTDTGAGMDNETLSRIFDPFFSTKENGRGLGLAAVLGIVRSHNGDLWVHSEVEQGTTFCLLLPKLQEDSVKSVADSASLMIPDFEKEAERVVLAIDDEEPVLEAVTDILALEGIEVMTASSGERGLELYRKNFQRIKLVLLDLSMPGMNGEETFQALREFDPTVRVVLSSGYDEGEAKGRFADTGLADFLQKPYDIDSLTAKVRQYL